MRKQEVNLNYALILNQIASNLELLYRIYMENEKDANAQTLFDGVNDVLKTTFELLKKDDLKEKTDGYKVYKNVSN